MEGRAAACRLKAPAHKSHLKLLICYCISLWHPLLYLSTPSLVRSWAADNNVPCLTHADGAAQWLICVGSEEWKGFERNNEREIDLRIVASGSFTGVAVSQGCFARCLHSLSPWKQKGVNRTAGGEGGGGSWLVPMWRRSPLTHEWIHIFKAAHHTRCHLEWAFLSLLFPYDLLSLLTEGLCCHDNSTDGCLNWTEKVPFFHPPTFLICSVKSFLFSWGTSGSWSCERMSSFHSAPYWQFVV